MKKVDDTSRGSLRAMLREIFRSSVGSVTVETAIVVPMMLMILLGFTELYLYMRTVSQVEHAAFTIADSLGQMTQVINDSSTSNSNNLGSIWNDAVLLAAPNILSKEGGVIVTSVYDSTANGALPATSKVKGTPAILWQASAPWTTGAMTTTETNSNVLPTTWPFRNGDSAIVVEVFYYYNPFTMIKPLWSDAPGVQKIYRRVYVRPRANKPLTLVPAS